eukprot:ctg_1230.g443
MERGREVAPRRRRRRCRERGGKGQSGEQGPGRERSRVAAVMSLWGEPGGRSLCHRCLCRDDVGALTVMARQERDARRSILNGTVAKVDAMPGE